MLGEFFGSSRADLSTGGRGEIVFKRSSSRVYSLHGNCAEETVRTRDTDRHFDEMQVTRVLRDQSCTFTKRRDHRTGSEEIRRSKVNVADGEEAAFDHTWMSAASQHLPAYWGARAAVSDDIPQRREPRGAPPQRPAERYAKRNSSTSSGQLLLQ